MPGVVKLNPELFRDERDALAVAWNEALRLFMEDTKFRPAFEPTAEQVKFFRETAYAEDPEAQKKTIVARIATFDTSIPRPTPEQVAETLRLLDTAIEVFDGQPDGETLKKMKAELENANKDMNSPVSQSPAQLPNGNIPVETAETGENIPERELEAQSAMGGGNVDEEALGYTVAMLKENEGFRPTAYWDKTGKKWTVGHGLTEYPDGRKVGPTDTITEEQSAAHMRAFVEKRLLPAASKNVPNWATMDPRLKAAMLDTGYNAGPGYFGSKSPSMLKRLAAGEDPAKVIAEENATWNKSGGVVVKGLSNRRQRVKEKLIDWYTRDANAASSNSRTTG